LGIRPLAITNEAAVPLGPALGLSAPAGAQALGASATASGMKALAPCSATKHTR